MNFLLIVMNSYFSFKLFECGNLGKKATTDVLHDLIYNLIIILVDPRLEDCNEGSNAVRSVNVMVVKIVEQSDPTCVMCALIMLLHESIASDSPNKRQADLTMLIMKVILYPQIPH